MAEGLGGLAGDLREVLERRVFGEVSLSEQMHISLLETSQSCGGWEELSWRSVGLPTEPRIHELVRSFSVWHQTGNLSYLNQSNFEGLQQYTEHHEKLQSHFPLLQRCFRDLPLLEASTRELKETWKEFLNLLDDRVVLTLLRMRYTAGSLPILPPLREKLLASFQQLHCSRPGVNLTVGARALSKHAHRASDGFWGVMKVGSQRGSFHC